MRSKASRESIERRNKNSVSTKQMYKVHNKIISYDIKYGENNLRVINS
jgi:hypothetical protein